VSKRRVARFVLIVLLVSAVGVATEAVSASGSSPTKYPATATTTKKKQKHKKKVTKAKVVTLVAATAWVDIAAQHKVTADKPAPDQFTDPTSPQVQQISALITGLDFKGIGYLTFNRTQPDPSDPSLLVGNYIVKVVVFGSAADAQKFRAADSNEVTGRGKLKQVDTYADGVVLDDGQGHINLMFTIGNVAVDIRTGIAEPTPGDGVKDIKTIGDDLVANSKKS
jgi:hypothetical protein